MGGRVRVLADSYSRGATYLDIRVPDARRPAAWRPRTAETTVNTQPAVETLQ